MSSLRESTKGQHMKKLKSAWKTVKKVAPVSKSWAKLTLAVFTVVAEYQALKTAIDKVLEDDDASKNQSGSN